MLKMNVLNAEIRITPEIRINPEVLVPGYSLEALRRGASNEYPQHTFSWINKRNISTFWLEECLITSNVEDLNQFNIYHSKQGLHHKINT